MSAERGLCAYAITRGERWGLFGPPELRAAGPPELIRHDGLALVVTEVDVSLFGGLDAEEPAEDGLLAALVRDHDAIVRAVFAHEPVLPLRFGTVVADEPAARRLLSSSRDEVTRWLDRVAGHREWGVRVDDGAQPVEETPLTGLSGADYLRRRRQSRLDGRQLKDQQADAARALHSALAGHATDVVHRTQRPQTLLDAAYLVPEANEDAFRRAAAELGEEARGRGATVHATGPWPPYSFTRLELGVTG